MATFSVRFLGCKVSYVDAQSVRERLLADGHTEVGDSGDIAVVNTCCVTHEAVSKSRQAVSKAARAHGRVYVTGCAAKLSGAFDSVAPNVRVISRPSEEAPDAVAGDVGAIACVQADARLERTRAFVKIQDGCSFSCAFCVIPSVRGATRSRKAAAVLGEIERRVAQGHREIVLTGVNLGCFRDREARCGLPRLVRLAGSLPGVERLRLSSIEVNHVTDELVAALRETRSASLHLHVPLQSGDDGVLHAMRRRYSVAQYVSKLEPLVDFNVTADVIVGFPGEDEVAFGRTLDVVREAGISRVHAFPYSPRPGTATAASDTVPVAEKRERSTRLRALSDELSHRRWASRIGSTDRVLLDRPGRGYGDDYTPWLLDGEVGQLLDARAVGVSEEGIVAVAA
jgi:threonylcarbamoyladenosine tRNA methylthiotransferase MtaB